VGVLAVEANRMHEVLGRILTNAEEAMPNGGKFMIRVEDAGERVRFSFSDNGPGIPEDIRDRLFETFVTSGKEDGTGLGLAVVKKIVDEHGGSIEAESPEEGGACFKISLPKRLDS